MVQNSLKVKDLGIKLLSEVEGRDLDIATNDRAGTESIYRLNVEVKESIWSQLGIWLRYSPGENHWLEISCKFSLA